MIDQLIQKVVEGEDPTSVLESRPIKIDNAWFRKMSVLIAKDILYYVNEGIDFDGLGSTMQAPHPKAMGIPKKQKTMFRTEYKSIEHPRSKLAVPSGRFWQRSSGTSGLPQIEFDINTAAPKQAFRIRALTSGVYDVLLHEATHFAEWLLRGKSLPKHTYDYAKMDTDPAEYKKYINDPKEVRARMQTIVDDFLKYFKKRPRAARMSPDIFLQGVGTRVSPTFKQIWGELSGKARKTMWKGIVTAMQDKGYWKTDGYDPSRAT